MSAYTWKTGAVVKTDANIAGKQFEQLEKSVGLTPQTVLDANRAKNAPLHNEFEWDNNTAAEKYRLKQAGYLLRSICLVVETEEHKAREVRAVFQTEYKGAYESIVTIYSDSEKHGALLRRALKELEAVTRKYETLSELQPIKAEIRKAMNKTKVITK